MDFYVLSSARMILREVSVLQNPDIPAVVFVKSVWDKRYISEKK